MPKPIDRSVRDLIAEIAERQRTPTAVHAWDGVLKYHQLNSLASKTAHRLIELGATPRSNIPMYCEKSKWTPVAMLGVIKAGCAAIALDPNFLGVRARSIVQQAEPQVLVSSTANLEKVSRLASILVLDLDEGFSAFRNTRTPYQVSLIRTRSM